jgi:threonine dehydrogenase-like Zn-dependent dehydrogenase
VHSVGKDSFEWIVDKVAKLAVEKAKGAGEPMKELKWSSFLGHEASGTVAAKKNAKEGSGSSTRVAIEKNAAEKREVKAAGKKRLSKKTVIG